MFIDPVSGLVPNNTKISDNSQRSIKWKDHNVENPTNLSTIIIKNAYQSCQETLDIDFDKFKDGELKQSFSKSPSSQSTNQIASIFEFSVKNSNQIQSTEIPAENINNPFTIEDNNVKNLKKQISDYNQNQTANTSVGISIQSEEQSIEDEEDLFGDESQGFASATDEISEAEQETEDNKFVGLNKTLIGTRAEVQGEKIEVQGEKIEVQGEKIEVQGEKIEVQEKEREVQEENREVQEKKAEVQEKRIEVQGKRIENKNFIKAVNSTFEFVTKTLAPLNAHDQIILKNIVQDKIFAQAVDKDLKKKFEFTQKETTQIAEDILKTARKEKILYQIGPNGTPIPISDEQFEELKIKLTANLLEQFSKLGILASTKSDEEIQKEKSNQSQNQSFEASKIDTKSYNSKSIENETNKEIIAFLINKKIKLEDIIQNFNQRNAKTKREEDELQQVHERQYRVIEKEEKQFDIKTENKKSEYINKNILADQINTFASKKIKEIQLSKKEQISKAVKQKIKDSADPEAPPIDIIDATQPKRPISA